MTDEELSSWRRGLDGEGRGRRSVCVLWGGLQTVSWTGIWKQVAGGSFVVRMTLQVVGRCLLWDSPVTAAGPAGCLSGGSSFSDQRPQRGLGFVTVDTMGLAQHLPQCRREDPGDHGRTAT